MNKILLSSLVVAALLVGCKSAPIKTDTNQQLQAASTDVTYSYAIKALKERRYQKAIELFKPFAKKDKASLSDVTNLAMAYRGAAEYKKSELLFKQALKRAPSNVDIINEFAILKREQGLFLQAKSQYEQALAMAPSNSKLHYNMGILCDLYLRNYECAIKHYKQYQQLNPSDKNIQIWLDDITKRQQPDA